MMLRERLLDVAHERGQLRPLARPRRAARRPARRGRAPRRSTRRCFTRCPAWTRIRRLPSGTLSMRATTPATPTVCSWSGPGVSRSGSLRAEHHEHPVAGQHVVDELDRALLADRQRRQRVRVGDRVAERQDRERVGEPVRRDARPRAAVASPSGPADRDGARARRPAQRQLDGQDPVLVGRLGGVGVDLGAERDDAPERAALDLELLVDAVVGRPFGLAVAGRARARGPRTSSWTAFGSIPARSARTTARGGSLA